MITVTFYHKGRALTYSVWEAKTTHYWYWEAGGSSGIEPTEFEARQRAIRWLKDGQ